jgi:hypothetical protein
MSLRIENMIQNYDMRALKSLYAEWESLDLRSRFACMHGFLALRDHAEAKVVFEENREYFRQHQLESFVQLNIDRETKSQFAEALMLAQKQDLSQIEDCFIRGEYEFTIALAHLQYGFYELAIQYYQKSIIQLETNEDLYFAYIWRSKFNIALCNLKLRDDSSFEKNFSELEATFSKMQPLAQTYLSRLLVWLYLFRNETKKAHDLILHYLPTAKNQEPFDYRISFLFKYFLFIALKERRPEDFRKLTAKYFARMLEPEQKVVRSIADCLFDFPKSIAEVRMRVDRWRKEHNLLDYQLICEMALQRILEEKNYTLLASAYEYIDNKSLTLKVILPACDLREFGLLAYQKTQRKILFNRLSVEYQAEAPQWRRREFQKCLDDQTKESVKIELDLPTRKIIFSGQIVSLVRKPKLFSFLKELFLHKKGISLKDLGSLIYGADSNENDSSRISALVFLSKKLFGIQFVIAEGKTIRIMPQFQTSLTRGYSNLSHARQTEIIKLARVKKQSLSVKDLEASLNYPRRSLQADLKSLVRSGRLTRVGRGRGSTYSLN